MVAKEDGYREMYHTQERRDDRIGEPIICIKDIAWLGDGYYFWDEILDAHKWGNDSKRKTGYYEIYSATIDCEDVLDTVFNEGAYNFWVRQIDKFTEQFTGRYGKPTIKEFNKWCRAKKVWNSLTGILFQDLPTKHEDLKIEGLFHRKRIQAAIFNDNIISNFAFLVEEKCK